MFPKKNQFKLLNINKLEDPIMSNETQLTMVKI